MKITIAKLLCNMKKSGPGGLDGITNECIEKNAFITDNHILKLILLEE